MLNRKITEFGLPPLVGYLLMIVLFIAFSIFLFMRIDLAAYIYGFIAIATTGSLSEAKRNEFLKNVYSELNYRKIRSLENLLLTLPFSIYLLFEQQFLLSALILFISGLLAVFQFKNEWNYTLPTPFAKTPFEFLVGFRQYYLAYFFLCFLVIMGISVGNFNLCLFALLMVFIIALSFYSKPEEAFFVWTFNLTPKAFLLQKIKIAGIHSSILVLPISIALIVFQPEQWWVVLLIMFIGYLFLVSIILAKYAAFPKPISVPEGLVLMFGIGLPPLLILIIPYFYNKAVKSLRAILI